MPNVTPRNVTRSICTPCHAKHLVCVYVFSIFLEKDVTVNYQSEVALVD
jgi:hypothetical protein